MRTNGISKDSTEFQYRSCINAFSEQKSYLQGNCLEKKKDYQNLEINKIANSKNDLEMKSPEKKNEIFRKEQEIKKKPITITEKKMPQIPKKKTEIKKNENCQHEELKKNVKEGFYYCKGCDSVLCYNCKQVFTDKNHLINCKNDGKEKNVNEGGWLAFIPSFLKCGKH